MYVIQGAVCINSDDLIDTLIFRAHDAAIHGSASNTRARLSPVWFPNKSARVERWVKSCRTCQTEPFRLARKAPPHGPLNLRPKADAPWQLVHIDHVPIGEDPTGKAAILHIQDAASRFSVFVPVFGLAADEVTDALNSHIGLFGPIGHIIHDGATSFTGHAFEAWCKLNGTTHKPTHAYTSRANGLNERVHGPLRRALGLLSGHDRAHWAHVLHKAQWVINTNVNRSIGVSPHEYLFARLPPPIISVFRDIVERSLAIECADALRSVCNWHALWSAVVSKEVYDRSSTATVFNAGDMVLLRIPQTSKQQPAWVGPMRVHAVEPDREGYYLIEQSHNGSVNNIVSVAVDHLRRYDDSRPGQVYTAPARHGTHAPSAIIGERGSGSSLHLHVQWEDGSSTYEPAAGAHKNHSLLRHPMARAYMGARKNAFMRASTSPLLSLD